MNSPLVRKYQQGFSEANRDFTKRWCFVATGLRYLNERRDNSPFSTENISKFFKAFPTGWVFVFAIL